MLSGEGKARERWKTTIGRISKTSTLYVQHAFFVHFFNLPLFCMTTTWNFAKLLSYTFNGGNVVHVLVHFFSLSLFSPCIWLVAASISHFVTAATKFSCCSSDKKTSLFFISCSRSLRHFSRGASLAYRLLFLFLCLSLALYSLLF